MLVDVVKISTVLRSVDGPFFNVMVTGYRPEGQYAPKDTSYGATYRFITGRPGHLGWSTCLDRGWEAGERNLLGEGRHDEGEAENETL